MPEQVGIYGVRKAGPSTQADRLGLYPAVLPTESVFLELCLIGPLPQNSNVVSEL